MIVFSVSSCSVGGAFVLFRYVFVTRCVSYPFNARQPTDLARKQNKVVKSQLHLIKDRFHGFLAGQTNIGEDG